MTHRLTRLLIPVVVACAVLSMPLQAGTIVAGKPEDLGFSSERLARIHETVQRHIDAKAIAGAVTMVVRNGRIAHHEAHGAIDIESKRPMPKDGVFRLASMSKPVTAAAVMMMLEEGKLRLTDPVSRFIPEFKGMKVAVPKPGFEAAAAAAQSGRGGRGGGSPVEVDLVPANREITVRDLLTHGSGLMSGLGQRASTSVVQRGPDDTLATYIPKLGAAVLVFQSGTLWR